MHPAFCEHYARCEGAEQQCHLHRHRWRLVERGGLGMLRDELVVGCAAVASIIPRQAEEAQDEQQAEHPCSGIPKLRD